MKTRTMASALAALLALPLLAATAIASNNAAVHPVAKGSLDRADRNIVVATFLIRGDKPTILVADRRDQRLDARCGFTD